MTEIDICNNALNLVGQGTHIESLTEQSKEADSCSRILQPCIDRCLDKYDWSFASKNEVILASNLVSGAVNPPFELTYSLPVDFRRATELHDIGNDSGYARRVTPKKHIPYKVYNFNNNLVIATNKEAPFVLQYQSAVVELSLLPPSFIEAVEYLMASYLIADLQKGVMAENQSIKMVQLAYQALKVCHTNDIPIGVEWIDEPKEEQNVDLIKARGYLGAGYGYKDFI